MKLSKLYLCNKIYGIEIYIRSRSQTFIFLATRVVEIDIQSK